MTSPQPVDVHVHVHIHSGSDDKLDQILTSVQDLQAKGTEMAADLTALTNEVAETRTVAASAVALIDGFGAQLDALMAEAEAGRVDVAAIQALRDQLDSANADLSDAVTRNTPEANPTPEPEPEEPPVEQPPAPPVEDGDNA